MRSEFVRLYKFYPPETAILNLEGRRLKLSLIKELNDPFEFEPFRLRDKDERVFWNALKQRISEVAGLISFCDNWSSPLMWSHYSKEHSGLCLGFDIRTNLVEKVRYSVEKRPLASVEGFVDNQDFNAMQYALTAKFKNWSYEQEHRIFTRLSEAILDGGMYFEPFSLDIQLAEVVIGVRSSISATQVRSLVGSRVKIINARQSFRRFGICRQRDPNVMK